MKKYKVRLVVNQENRDILVDSNTALYEVAESYQNQYEDQIILAMFNGKLMELTKTLEKDGSLQFITVKDRDGKRVYRRSMIFVLQKAVQMRFGSKALLKVCHSLGEGYYCRIYSEGSPIILDEKDLEQLSALIDEIVAKDLPILKHNMPTEKAEELFHELGMIEKEKLLYYRRSSLTNIYELDGTFGYFYGYMAQSTGMLQYYKLERYDDSFVIVFPGADSRKVESLVTSAKLYHTLKESRDWAKNLGVGCVGAMNEAISTGRGQEVMLLQEAEMEDRIGNLASLITQKEDVRFIMIAGPSSSGKTSFCNRLSIQLIAKGKHPHPISLDDYYANREDIPKKADGSYDFECLEALDVELFNKNMVTLLEGGTIDMPSYNFKTGMREYRGNQLTLGQDDVLVIEGIHGLNSRLSYSLPDEKKYKIYISALTQLNIDEHNPLPTTDGRLLRRMVRDARTRGTTAKNTIAMWPSVRAGEEENIFPFQESADYMFNSALVYELPVLKVYAEPLLFQIKKGEPEYIEAQRLLKLLDYVLPLPVEGISHNSLLREFAGGSCFNV